MPTTSAPAAAVNTKPAATVTSTTEATSSAPVVADVGTSKPAANITRRRRSLSSHKTRTSARRK